MKKALSILALLTGLSGCTETASLHREFQQRIGRATTVDERRRIQLSYDLFCVTEKGSLATHFNPRDGVSELEVWMLANVYASEEIGFCLDLGLPQRREQRWEVSTFIGRPGQNGPPIVIDAISGTITCEGYPTVVRPREYLAKHEAMFTRPNKAPEPTPGAVTPRATEGTSK